MGDSFAKILGKGRIGNSAARGVAPVASKHPYPGIDGSGKSTRAQVSLDLPEGALGLPECLSKLSSNCLNMPRCFPGPSCVPVWLALGISLRMPWGFTGLPEAIPSK